MVSWSIFKGSAKEWNDLMHSLPFYSFYQSYEWGEIKSKDGWQVVRVIKKDTLRKDLSMAQVLLKRLPFKGAFFWCPGGILGAEKKIDWKFILKDLNILFYYFRCSFHDSNLSVGDLESLGWEKPTFLINNNQSMFLKPSAYKEDLLKRMSSNWRHNLRRFEKKNLIVTRWIKPDSATLSGYYEKFEAMKGLGRQHSFELINGVIEQYGDQLVILETKDSEGNLHSLRGCIVFGKNALDWYAITTELGRNTYSSYGVLWKLIDFLHELGVDHYDLSGVDEINNPGVFSFKKGAGGTLVAYPGELEEANFPGLKTAMNMILKRKFKI